MMNLVRQLARRVRLLWSRDRVERELTDELRQHIELEAEELIREGWTPEQARREARRRFGGEESTKERVRDARGGRLLLDLLQDVRYAGRQLRKSPGFAAVAVLTLALGIGANAMVFGLVEATLLREPAVRSPETLATVYVCESGESRCSSSYPDYLDYRERTTAFEDLAAHSERELSVGTETSAEVVRGELVSGNYFDVLGVSPARGRLLQPSDDDPASDVRVAVVSYEFWRSRLGGEPDAIGASVRINDIPFTVVGVVDPSFKGLKLGDSRSIWVPLHAQNDLGLSGRFDLITMRGLSWIDGLVARLRSDVTVERARAEIRAVSEQLATEYESNRDRRTVTLDPLRSYIRPAGSEPTLSTFVWILQGVVGFTLLLACANLANLLLARGSSRRRELAVRMAIGAGRTRIFHQLMTESLMLAVAGAAGGLLLASFALSAVGSFQLPFGFSVGSLDAAINLPVAGFTALVAFATVIAFGTLPGFQGTRGDLASDLRDGRATGGRRFRSLLRSLVGVQIAICFLLLIGAGLFLRTLRHQLTTDFGFQSEGVAVMVLHPGMSGYDQAGSVRLAGEMVNALNGVPGVEVASAGTSVPIVSTDAGTSVQVDGYSPAPDEEMRLEFADVAPEYFRTLRIPIERGREFTSLDAPGGSPEIVINQAMADAWWPGRDPIGGVVRFMGQEYNVVGVAGEVAWEGLAKSTTAYAFRSLLQVQDSPFGTLRIILRADPGDLDSLLPVMRDRLREIDPNLAVADLFTMPHAINVILAPERAGAVFLSAFGALALLLASVGIYGVVAYAVEQRRREFGIRKALGAPIGALVSLVACGMGVPVVLGIAGGLAAVLALGPVVRDVIVGVEPGDPVTMVLTVAVLGFAALMATVVPARRAARADPMEAMRAE